MPPIVALAQIVVEFRETLFGEEAVDPDPAGGRISGGQPFDGTIDDLVSQEELRKISDYYKKVAGFSLQSAK